MKIGDINIADVLAGKNWRFVPAEDETFEAPMEEWEGVQEAGKFKDDDHVIYSGVYVTATEVRPFLTIKELGDGEEGGDCCEYREGRWRQVGLEPNPDAAVAQEYIADPLAADASFLEAEERKEHRQGFKANVGRVSREDGGLGEPQAKPIKTAGSTAKPKDWLMSKKAIADAGLAELLVAFQEAVAAREHEWLDGSVAKGNRLEEFRGAIFDELKRRGRESVYALMPLLKDKRLSVRFSAAADMLEFEPKKAERVLKKLTHAKTVVSLQARMVLDLWQKGQLVFQKEKGLSGPDEK